MKTKDKGNLKLIKGANGPMADLVEILRNSPGGQVVRILRQVELIIRRIDLLLGQARTQKEPKITKTVAEIAKISKKAGQLLDQLPSQEAVKEDMENTLDIIGEVSPEVHERILKAMKARRKKTP